MSYSFNAGEVFKLAVRIEENGWRFYEESQKNISSTDVRTLFADLALQEIEHKKKFEAILAQLPAELKSATVWDPEHEIDQYIKMMADDHVFISGDISDQIGRIRNASDALKLAIEFEKDTVLFFLSLEEAVAGKKDWEFIKGLVKEEQEHVRRLTLELRKTASVK